MSNHPLNQKNKNHMMNRRALMAATGATSLSLATSKFAQAKTSLETLAGTLSPIGMGTWLTFNISENDITAMEKRAEVLEVFFSHGGNMIDSSPMYGPAENIIGKLVNKGGHYGDTFFATKIWTPLGRDGEGQLREAKAYFNLQKSDPLDLMYVHNLLKWKTHLPMLREAKARGDIKYIGLTTSHGRRHNDLEHLMKTEPMDAVQFTYNVLDREAEARLLPAAQDAGLSVIINRPFQGGGLFRRVGNHPIPDWAAEIDCENWAQIFLKFIISHPAVTSAIPATSRPEHMAENMGALTGQMPDTAFRRRIICHVESLV